MDEAKRTLERAALFTELFGCRSEEEIKEKIINLYRYYRILPKPGPTLEMFEKQMNKIGRFFYVVVRSKLPFKGDGVHRFLTICLIEHLDEEGHTKQEGGMPLVSRGVAICHIKDNYDSYQGKKIAARRALRAASREYRVMCRITGQIPSVLARLIDEGASPVVTEMNATTGEWRAEVGVHHAYPTLVEAERQAILNASIGTASERAEG